MNKGIAAPLFTAAALLGVIAASPAFLAAGKEETLRSMAVGDEAPSFILPDAEGRSIDMTPLLGSKVVVLWFTNLCPGCRASLPSVTDLKDRFKGRPAEVVGVVVPGAGDLSAFRRAMKSARADFPLLLDKQGLASERFTGAHLSGGVCPLANLYVIDLRGNVSYVGHLPGVGDEELQTVVNESLSTKGTTSKGEKR